MAHPGQQARPQPDGSCAFNLPRPQSDGSRTFNQVLPLHNYYNYLLYFLYLLSAFNQASWLSHLNDSVMARRSGMLGQAVQSVTPPAVGTCANQTRALFNHTLALSNHTRASGTGTP